MRKKLFSSLVLFAMLISLLLSILLIGGMYMYFSEQLQTQLRDEANTLTSLLKTQEDPAAYLETGIFVNRVTLIDSSGVVRFDSEADPAMMESHADRPEVIDAISTGAGSSSRSSATLGETSVYYAQKLDDAYVLRVAGHAQKRMGHGQRDDRVDCAGLHHLHGSGLSAGQTHHRFVDPALESNQSGRSPAIGRV